MNGEEALEISSSLILDLNFEMDMLSGFVSGFVFYIYLVLDVKGPCSIDNLLSSNFVLLF